MNTPSLIIIIAKLEFCKRVYTVRDKDLEMPFKHKNHTSLEHIGLNIACQDSSRKRPLKL